MVALRRVCADASARGQPFDACIHFAGLKAVGESVLEPLRYYEHNVGGTINLLRTLDEHGCRRLVFSSSATVYGQPDVNPVPETARLTTSNPYGTTKLVIEGMLREAAAATASSNENGCWRIVILRYFNPIGAHPSGQIGEHPQGVPNNLLPYVMQVAIGQREAIQVFGNDFATPDGTGCRDYIHVTDLVAGHMAALQHGLFGDALAGQACDVFNLGCGRPVSVLEVIRAAESVVGRRLPVATRPSTTPTSASPRVYCTGSHKKRSKRLSPTAGVGKQPILTAFLISLAT